MKKIFIKGNILAIGNVEIPQNVVINSTYNENDIDEITEGNILVIDKNHPFDKNANYYISGGLTLMSENSKGDIDNLDNIFSNYGYAIKEYQKLLELNIADAYTLFTIHKCVFIGVFAAMESFLYDLCQLFILNNELYMNNYLKTQNVFQKKISLCEIFVECTKMKDYVIQCMQETVYHNLDNVKRIFEQTFNIKFPEVTEMKQYIGIRHDLIHRNGHKKDGEVVRIDSLEINNFIKRMNCLVGNIFSEMKNLEINETSKNNKPTACIDGGASSQETLSRKA